MWDAEKTINDKDASMVQRSYTALDNNFIDHIWTNLNSLHLLSTGRINIATVVPVLRVKEGKTEGCFLSFRKYT